jgi:hypothetical protein
VTFCEFKNGPFKAKASNAELLRVHTMLVIGGRDMEDSFVSVRLHHGGPQGAGIKIVIPILEQGLRTRSRHEFSFTRKHDD